VTGWRRWSNAVFTFRLKRTQRSSADRCARERRKDCGVRGGWVVFANRSRLASRSSKRLSADLQKRTLESKAHAYYAPPGDSDGARFDCLICVARATRLLAPQQVRSRLPFSAVGNIDAASGSYGAGRKHRCPLLPHQRDHRAFFAAISAPPTAPTAPPISAPFVLLW